jgi:nicotinamidase/pyrazinamidase
VTTLTTRRALILVDIQRDFLPDGALPVPDGDAIMPVVNSLQPQFEIVAATQDFHPAEHLSFAANHPGHSVGDTVDLDGVEQILWPTHCVQGTRGATFAPFMELEHMQMVFQKGRDVRADSYSGFFDNGGKNPSGLADWLREREVNHIFLAGLATDYCVKYTAMDARKLGLDVTVVVDACRGVGLQKGDIGRAIADMREAGVTVGFARELGLS